MNTKDINVKVGIFVFIGAITLGLTIIFLGGNKLLFTKYNPYIIKFTQIQGLNIGSVVSLAGIKVGNVTEISYGTDSEGIDLIVQIETKYSPRITENSVASVKTSGALGDKFIYIDPGTPGATPISKNGFIPQVESPDFLDILSKNGPEFTRALDVLKEIKTLIGHLNKDEKSARFMDSLLSSSNNLNSLLIEARKTLTALRGDDKNSNQLKQSMASLNSILQKIDTGDGSLGALINDPAIYDRILKLLGTPKRSLYLKSLIRTTIQTQEHNQEHNQEQNPEQKQKLNNSNDAKSKRVK